MGQADVLKFLRENKERWFTFDEIKKECPEANYRPLMILIRFGLVKRKYEKAKISYKKMNGKTCKKDHIIAFYKYANLR